MNETATSPGHPKQITITSSRSGGSHGKQSYWLMKRVVPTPLVVVHTESLDAPPSGVEPFAPGPDGETLARQVAAASGDGSVTTRTLLKAFQSLYLASSSPERPERALVELHGAWQANDPEAAPLLCELQEQVGPLAREGREFITTLVKDGTDLSLAALVEMAGELSPEWEKPAISRAAQAGPRELPSGSLLGFQEDRFVYQATSYATFAPAEVGVETDRDDVRLLFVRAGSGFRVLWVTELEDDHTFASADEGTEFVLAADRDGNPPGHFGRTASETVAFLQNFKGVPALPPEQGSAEPEDRGGSVKTVPAHTEYSLRNPDASRKLHEEHGAVVSYLEGGEVLLVAGGLDMDLYTGQTAVPIGTATDGEYVWSLETSYYARVHGILPLSTELVEKAVAAGGQCPQVSPARAQEVLEAILPQFGGSGPTQGINPFA